MRRDMPQFRSINGNHIVTYRGVDHVFSSLESAWMYIFALRHIIHVVSTNIRVHGGTRI